MTTADHRLVPALLLAALVPATGACAASLARPDPNPLMGCHYFIRDADAEGLGLPWGIQLYDEPLEGWPALQQRGDVRRAATLTGDGREAFPFGYWLAPARDSLEIGYPAGGGLILRLVVGDRVTGAATPVGDAIPYGEAQDRAPVAVRLIHAQCPED
jgi:hypothetical protein